jgi:hypothetical protein
MKRINLNPKWTDNYNRSWKSILVLLFLIFGVCITSWKAQEVFAHYRITKIEPELKREQMISQLWGEAKALKQALDKKLPSYTQKEIEDYVRVIFGKDAKVALAVSYHECNPKNKAYPKCVALSDKEMSIGIFQINLKNKTHLIHASKIPGKTLEEKAESLKDPYINTLVAYKIFSDSKGFGPWSAYTSGSYKLSLNEK